MMIPMIWPDLLACLVKGTNTLGTEKCKGLTPIPNSKAAGQAMSSHNACSKLDSNTDCTKAPANGTDACKCQAGMYAP